MAHIHLPRPWNLPESAAAPEDVYVNRRDFLRRLGLGSLGAVALLSACGSDAGGTDGDAAADGIRGARRADQERGPLDNIPETPTAGLYPEAPEDGRFGPGPRHGSLTAEEVTAAYNNFYEFGTDKEGVWRMVDRFEARPWAVEVGGLVERPRTYDLADLERRMGLEGRVYRLRCVEAWSIAVPWIGFPLRKLLLEVGPAPEARYVRLTSFLRPDQAPGQERQTWYTWPYYEALRMDEAMHELTFLVTGMYGHPLQKQNGAPVRLAVPWKYGFKSIKSIRKIELTRERPPTFWNDAQPNEYSWLSNVDPEVPHPRWSQAEETIVQTGEKVPTLAYNGYGEWVASLYG